MTHETNMENLVNISQSVIRSKDAQISELKRVVRILTDYVRSLEQSQEYWSRRAAELEGEDNE